jgi:hypothetical protein
MKTLTEPTARSRDQMRDGMQRNEEHADRCRKVAFAKREGTVFFTALDTMMENPNIKHRRGLVNFLQYSAQFIHYSLSANSREKNTIKQMH